LSEVNGLLRSNFEGGAKVTIASRLREKYKTREELDKAADAAGGRSELARRLGLSKQNLNEHARYLGHGNNRSVLKNKWGLKTIEETNATIKELFRGEQSMVKVYKLTDDYIPNSSGYEGLVYLRTEQPKMMLSPWARSN
jgi:hypothetical protein